MPPTVCTSAASSIPCSGCLCSSDFPIIQSKVCQFSLIVCFSALVSLCYLRSISSFTLKSRLAHEPFNLVLCLCVYFWLLVLRNEKSRERVQCRESKNLSHDCFLIHYSLGVISSFASSLSAFLSVKGRP